MPDVLYAAIALSAFGASESAPEDFKGLHRLPVLRARSPFSPWLATDTVAGCPATPSFGVLRKLEMLTHFTEASARALWSARSEPRVSRPVVRLQALAHRIQRAFLFIGATTLAASIVIFLRVVLTAHLLPLAGGVGAVPAVPRRRVRLAICNAH